MYLHLAPKFPLSEHIRLLWLYQGYTPTSPRERLLPTGTVEIVFDLSNQPSKIFKDDTDLTGHTFRDSLICGPHSRYFVLDTSAPHTVAGIHFAPGGAAAFFRTPLHELRDRHVSLDALWSHSKASEIRDQIFAAPTARAKLRALEQALAKLVTHPRHPAVDFAVQRLAQIPQIETLERIISRIALSPRRFIELFNQEIGLTPKLFCRVMRFQATIQNLDSGLPINWSALAADCGYFDQSHFIHDFKAFSGLSPTRYAQLRGPHLNHVPLR